jgi:aminoglycoside phosphotransferase (APT) family kinase protein
MKGEIARFFAEQWSIPRHLLDVQVEPVYGGLESRVTRATVTVHAPHGGVPQQFVVKQMPPSGRREADIYRTLWAYLARPPAARMVGEQSFGGHAYLYLEDVPAMALWPWTETARAEVVCRALARFHEAPELPRDVFDWDYDAQLVHSAQATLDLAVTALYRDGTRCWRRLGDLRRVVAALPAIRSRLLRSGQTVIHGDVHPGNVLLRRDSQSRVAFIDWSRARLGSPLEDVACWLHSLGCWEPQARRRHDTLLRAYLNERDPGSPLTPALRTDYWLASVSNGLSGAIRYHLAVVAAPESLPVRRVESGRALTAWERVVRRAASLLSTSQSRCN